MILVGGGTPISCDCFLFRKEMVTDQVEVKSGRVEVEQNSSNEDTGYLAELDQRLVEYSYSGKNETWFEINAREGSNSRYILF